MCSPVHGDRMERTDDLINEYESAFNDYMQDPKNEGLKQRVEEPAETFHESGDYETLKEKGEDVTFAALMESAKEKWRVTGKGARMKKE